jgi:hypothetical protein
MQKPNLEITERQNGIPIRGKCSSCADTEFTAKLRSIEKNQQLLDKMFADHVKRIHMREDANQAASRVVPEATEGK